MIYRNIRVGRFSQLKEVARQVTILFVSCGFAFGQGANLFEIIEGNFTWSEAKADAEARGGRLAVLDTQEKVDASRAFLTPNGPTVFIGLTDEEQEGQWKWITGESLEIDNWLSGQPGGGVNENYAVIYPDQNSGWNDVPTDHRQSYLFERLESLQNLQLVIIEGDFTWDEAKADAEARGGRLAVLNTQERIDTAKIYLDSLSTAQIGKAWIGLSNDIATSPKNLPENFQWITGESLTASNWHPGTPNNNNGTGAALQRWDSGSVYGWDDDTRTNRQNYLLEISDSAKQGLFVDFNSNQAGGGNPISGDPANTSSPLKNTGGYQSYHVAHEISSDFVSATYKSSLDGAPEITVSPSWPNTTDNRVMQSIGRTDEFNTFYTDPGDYPLSLVTDWIGIDTRIASGGNGDYNGSVGTPTWMEIKLSGLPPGDYDWTSIHHDTENVFCDFRVYVDGVFVGEGYMSDSTPNGNPDSITPGSVSTFSTVLTTTGEDITIRFEPLSGSLGSAVHNQLFGINGFQLTNATGSKKGLRLTKEPQQYGRVQQRVSIAEGRRYRSVVEVEGEYIHSNSNKMPELRFPSREVNSESFTVSYDGEKTTIENTFTGDVTNDAQFLTYALWTVDELIFRKIELIDLETGQNLIRNGDFKNGLAFWRTNGGTIDIIDSGRPVTFTLSEGTSSSGGTTAGFGEFEAGSSTTLTATPAAGYIFTGWNGDASGTNNPLNITVSENKTIGATFAPDTRDSDNDGITNYQEIVEFGSNPNDNDTDNDGITDGAEIDAGLNILQPETISEAVAFLIGARDAALFLRNQAIAERDARPTLEEVKDARLGSVLLLPNATTNKVKLRFTIEESNELGTWTSRTEEAEVDIPLDPGKKFFRFSVKEDGQ